MGANGLPKNSAASAVTRQAMGTLEMYAVKIASSIESGHWLGCAACVAPGPADFPCGAGTTMTATATIVTMNTTTMTTNTTTMTTAATAMSTRTGTRRTGRV